MTFLPSFPSADGTMRSPGRRLLQLRLLQLTVAIAALVPVVAGAWGVLGGMKAASLSQERYLSGLLLAIGIGFWTTVPSIEGKTRLFRVLTLLVVGGGLCRLLGVALGDRLDGSVGGPVLMELVVTPLLCLWQARVAAGRRAVVATPRPLTESECAPGDPWRRAKDSVVDALERPVARLLCWGVGVSRATYIRSKGGPRKPK
jgi:hypothetical protein